MTYTVYPTLQLKWSLLYGWVSDLTVRHKKAYIQVFLRDEIGLRPLASLIYRYG